MLYVLVTSTSFLVSLVSEQHSQSAALLECDKDKERLEKSLHQGKKAGSRFFPTFLLNNTKKKPTTTFCYNYYAIVDEC